jgi:Domain of unknown function (DUF4863)
MTQQAFSELIATLTASIAQKPLDPALQQELNERYPPAGHVYREVFDACRAAIAEGWMCSREAGGIRYGRVIKAGEATHGFSVDVVEMNDASGPHHRHPNGEIDMIMPLTPDAKFDGHGAGWLVYPPGSAHVPRVTNGNALILYLLPQGAIEFTKA